MSTVLLLPESPPPASKAMRLAKLLPGIEAALRQGYTHDVIFEHINNTEGLDLTFKYYKTTLHRLRKRRAATQADKAQHSVPFSRARENNGEVRKALPDVTSTVPDDAGEKFTYDVKAPIDDFFS